MAGAHPLCFIFELYFHRWASQIIPINKKTVQVFTPPEQILSTVLLLIITYNMYLSNCKEVLMIILSNLCDDQTGSIFPGNIFFEVKHFCRARRQKKFFIFSAPRLT